MENRFNLQFGRSNKDLRSRIVDALPLRLAMTVQDAIIAVPLFLNQWQLLQVSSQCVGDNADGLAIPYARNLPCHCLELIGERCDGPQPEYLPQQPAHHG